MIINELFKEQQITFEKNRQRNRKGKVIRQKGINNLAIIIFTIRKSVQSIIFLFYLQILNTPKHSFLGPNQ